MVNQDNSFYWIAIVQSDNSLKELQMQNTTNSNNGNNGATATVVQNDTNNAAAAAHAAGYKRIEQLIVEREVWEQGVVRTTNEQLYALLAQCYALYGEMCTGTAAADFLNAALA